MELLQHRMNVHDDLPFVREDHHGHRPARMVLSSPWTCAVVAKGLGGRYISRRGRYHSNAFPPLLRAFLANPNKFCDAHQPPKGGGPTISPGCQPWESNHPSEESPESGDSLTSAPSRLIRCHAPPPPHGSRMTNHDPRGAGPQTCRVGTPTDTGRFTTHESRNTIPRRSL